MPTKKQRKLLKKGGKGKERLKYHRRAKLKRFLLVVVAILILGGVVSGGWFLGTRSSSPTGTEGEEINKFIAPQQAFTLMQENQNNPNFVIIDDRSSEAFGSGHIAGAINIPFSNFSASVSSMDRNKIYLVYCPSGCGATSDMMKGLGFKEVYEIQGGLGAWQSEGLPIVQ